MAYIAMRSPNDGYIAGSADITMHPNNRGYAILVLRYKGAKRELRAINKDAATLTFYPFPVDSIRCRMKEILNSDNPGIDSILDYLTENNGKMLRPRLVSIAASISAPESVVVIDIAVAVELIHLASLVHDDVIDHAMVRRGQESLNSRWGNHISILTGDYLFATAFYLINKHDMQDVMENITTTIRIMCAGEIKQMSLTGNLDITEDQYLEKIYGKTACLFASSCKVGALASSVDSLSVYALEQFGLFLGYAYQIIDDLLDFLSDSTLLGKPVGNDLREGNITLPVIHALRNKEYGPLLRSLLEKPKLTDQQMAKVIEILVESKAVESSLDSARHFIARGLDGLNALPASPAHYELQHMASYLMETYFQKLSYNNQKKTRRGSSCDYCAGQYVEIWI